MEISSHKLTWNGRRCFVFAILLLFLHGTSATTFPVWWHAPFFSGSGYGSEALNYVLGLASMAAINPHLYISHHGDTAQQEVVRGLPGVERQQLFQLLRSPEEQHRKRAIVICHSEPGAWSVPRALYSTEACPPVRHVGYRVGRTMFETDRLTPEHARRCNQMDEVWVPTQFHINTFSASGVERHRLFAIPQGVDTMFFDPAKHPPMQMPTGSLVFGTGMTHEEATRRSTFVFISIFKWEERKAWDVLLRAFLSEFESSEPVALVLLTKPYHSTSNFHSKIITWASENICTAANKMDPKGYPTVYVESRHIPQHLLPGVYKAADAFVLPSRGEGWGRPHVEAMAMGLPVIATNWSGPTAFLSDLVGYPLRINGLVNITAGPFAGHKWADPSVPHLKQLMRQVVSNRSQAIEKGRLAREHMVANFSQGTASEKVLLENGAWLLEAAHGALISSAPGVPST